ncbi:hypothetical protein D3C79_893140 [compost metagenome]
MEQCRNLLLVGLQLVEGAQQMCPRAARRFQLDHTQRQAVNEHHHIGSPLVLAVDHNELAHRQPVVQFRMFEIDKRDLASGQGAIIGVVFDVHTFRH